MKFIKLSYIVKIYILIIDPFIMIKKLSYFRDNSIIILESPYQ